MQRVKNSAVIIADCGCSQRSAPSLCRPQAELSAPGFGIYKNSVAAWGLRVTQWALTLAQIPSIALNDTHNLSRRSMKDILTTVI